MAPSLLGYHKRVVCPVCRFPFAYGIVFDKPDPKKMHAKCPNCGQNNIDISGVPRNQGDQLLVLKHAFSFILPDRWEVIVFRNPNNPTQAYVKRVVGLPGEDLLIVDGDIWINGDIARKNLTQQRAIRIPVFDSQFEPSDEVWQSRWKADGQWKSSTNGRFSLKQPRGVEGTRKESLSWIGYEHWIRSGGEHHSVVPIAAWPSQVKIPNPIFSPLRFDARRGQLTCQGVMADDLRDSMLSQSKDSAFRDSIWNLYQESHMSPIDDRYGYNRSSVLTEHTSVRDLMVSMQIALNSGRGEMVVRMTDGRNVYDCLFDFGQDELRVMKDVANAEPLIQIPLPKKLLSTNFLFEMSLFDQNLLIAVDGETLVDRPFDSVRNPNSKLIAPRRPVSIAAKGLDVDIRDLRLFRDVFYTSKSARNGVATSFRSGNDEYFCLGDNSPVSLDSRAWDVAAVNRRMLLGKPILVHLPSKPAKLRIGRYESYFRIPDFSRIRYIR